MPNTFHRSCKLSLKFATKAKRQKVNNLLIAYRAGVNFFINIIWNRNDCKLNKETLSKLKNTRLSERYKSQALKQALEICILTKKSAKVKKKFAKKPLFQGNAKLDAKFINIENGNKSFDLVIRLSTLHKGHLINIPIKRTKVLNKWLSFENAKLIQGCLLNENTIALCIEIPKLPTKAKGKVVGIDINANKLLVTSSNGKYGKRFKTIRDKIQRKQKYSKAYYKALAERDNYINQSVNRLPWHKYKIIGLEDLTNIKTGKKKNRNKAFRKAMSSWTFRRVLDRLEEKAQENRVCHVYIEPANTSRTCPRCNKISNKNRKGEYFKCIDCSYSNDADYVGAFNVLTKTLRFLGSVESPRLQKSTST